MIAWLKARAALVEENRLLKFEVARRDYILSGFAKYEEAVKVYRAQRDEALERLRSME